jgi:hypothetical protein
MPWNWARNVPPAPSTAASASETTLAKRPRTSFS